MYRTIKAIFLFLFFIFCYQLNAQSFTHDDTLRGSYGPSRNWWDVTKYDLHVKFNLQDSTISGYNEMHFKVLKKGDVMQIDLQEPMILDSIIYSIPSPWNKPGITKIAFGVTLKKDDFRKDGNAYFFNEKNFSPRTLNNITVYYHGKPNIAMNPPWGDGGLVWKKDKNNNPWITITCQGSGASVWYPCKDHQADKPDSAEMHFTIPDTLVCVSNGKLRDVKKNDDGTVTYDWAVVNPINNYNIIPYIGKYVHFGETYKGEKGNLDLDYWVMDYNLEKARIHFTEVPKMMKAFEYWFGPYPFYEDGYKLVESPHLGMEHQSAIAYGNGYQGGYLGLGRDQSNVGLKWDYIIIHESGHEWFGNSITSKDIADMWIHESFANYSEVLYTEYYYSKKTASEYVIGLRKRIHNYQPIIGVYNVNNEGSLDMYEKGANVIHTIRQIINNDDLFRNILRGMNKTFYHRTVTSKEIETYISKQSKIDFSKIFNQYLRTASVPVLEYKLSGNKLSYRFINCINGFTMPVKINFNGNRWIRPSKKWQTLDPGSKDIFTFSVDPNFYIFTKKLD